MKILKALILILLLCFGISARAKYSSYAQKGGKDVKTSTTVKYELMESYPACTITVYLSGTTTLATIYFDSAGSPQANPFTANTDAYFQFYADDGRYDIKFSGTGITTPFTRADILLLNPYPLALTSASIENMIDENVGNVIQLVSGTYIVSGSTINISGKTNITIRGAAGTIIDNSGNSFRAFTVDGSSNITFEDIVIKGDYDQSLPTDPEAGGIVVNAASFDVVSTVKLINVECKNIRGDCIRFGPNTKYSKIIRGGMNGGLGYLELSGIAGSKPVEDILVDGVTVIGTLSGGISDGGFGLSGSDDLVDGYGGLLNIRIKNSYFEIPNATAATTTTNSAGIHFLASSIGGQGINEGIDISNCTFVNFNSTGVGAPSQSAIWIDANEYPAGFKNVKISDNIIKNSRNGISITNSTGIGIEVNNNLLEICTRCIDNQNSDDVIINSNIIKYPTDMGAYLQGNNVVFHKNRLFLDTTLTVNNKTGIYSTTGAIRNISNNIVSGGVAGSSSVKLVGGIGTNFLNNTILSNPGIGLDIPFASALGINVKGVSLISGNGTNVNNADVTTALDQALFVGLGTPINGTTTYCSDCNIANPCTGAGTGAFAKRLNGIWVCN